ncbi:hypothetical protein HEB94_001270 [Actinopolymorpha pittospori]|uniref:NADP-dependent oxidoreductase domain-containing protein n=1 Tax=Actinopolymorpha pittospori TaxID=648752 RepID=A0A927MW68_9ACTN|nr:hypothetical protein [Actinopolymorpha pittospori]
MPWYSEENIDHNLSTIDVVRAIAAEVDATPGQVALAWLLAKAPDVVPIPGTRRLAFFEENSLASNLTLTAEHIAALERITVAGDRNTAPPSTRGTGSTASRRLVEHHHPGSPRRAGKSKRPRVGITSSGLCRNHELTTLSVVPTSSSHGHQRTTYLIVLARKDHPVRVK